MALSQGITDLFERQGKICFGPKQFAAQLESSKDFAKQFNGTSRHTTDRPLSVIYRPGEAKNVRERVRLTTSWSKRTDWRPARA